MILYCFFKQKLQFRPVDVDFILKHDAVDTKPHHDQFKTYVWIKTNENIGTFHYYNRLILFQGMIPAYTLLLQPIFQTLQWLKRLFDLTAGSATVWPP